MLLSIYNNFLSINFTFYFTFHYLKTGEIKAKEELQRLKEEGEARYELQITALNENLTTLRLDMNTNATRMGELDKATDELRGEKLGA